MAKQELIFADLQNEVRVPYQKIKEAVDTRDGILVEQERVRRKLTGYAIGDGALGVPNMVARNVKVGATSIIQAAAIYGFSWLLTSKTPSRDADPLRQLAERPDLAVDSQNGTPMSNINMTDLFKGADDLRWERRHQIFLNFFALPSLSMAPGAVVLENASTIIAQNPHLAPAAIAASILVSAGGLIDSVRTAVHARPVLKKTPLEQHVEKMGGFKRSTRRLVAQAIRARQ